jgi:hypothetical protein
MNPQVKGPPESSGGPFTVATHCSPPPATAAPASAIRWPCGRAASAIPASGPGATVVIAATLTASTVAAAGTAAATIAAAAVTAAITPIGCALIPIARASITAVDLRPYGTLAARLRPVDPRLFFPPRRPGLRLWIALPTRCALDLRLSVAFRLRLALRLPLALRLRITLRLRIATRRPDLDGHVIAT